MHGGTLRKKRLPDLSMYLWSFLCKVIPGSTKCTLPNPTEYHFHSRPSTAAPGQALSYWETRADYFLDILLVTSSVLLKPPTDIF